MSLRQNKLVIYKLKRQWGERVDFYELKRNDHNILTGEIKRDYVVHKIRKAIILEGILSRASVYDLAYIAAAKNFTGGAYFDKTDQTVIIDSADLPKDLTPSIKMHLQFREKRFEVINITIIPNASIYVIAVRALSNSQVN